MIGTDSLSDSAERAYAAAAEEAEISRRKGDHEPAPAPSTAPIEPIAAPAPAIPSTLLQTPEEHPVTDSIENKTENAAATVEQKADNAAVTVGQTAATAAEKVDATAGTAAAKVGKGAAKVEQKTEKAASKVQVAASNAAETVEHKADEVAAKVEEKTDDAAEAAVKVETKVKKSAEEFSAKVQDAVKDAQARAKAAYDKNKDRLGDVGEFTKGNIEALREAGKILASGIKVLGKTYVEETKANFGSIRANVQELRTVKSPGEFVKLQGSMVRTYFASAKARNSKQSQAVRKLANEAFQPISHRVSLAKDKVKKAA